MTILHVNKFFDLHRGAEIYMHALMDEQRRQGHEVHVLSTRSAKNPPSEDAGRFVARADLSQSEGVMKDAQKALNFFWNREAKQAMEAAIRELKPDVIHLHNIYHHLSTSMLDPIRRSGIPCVQTLHDLKLACPNYKMYTEGSPCERCKGGKYYQATLHRCLWPSLIPNMLASAEMYFSKGSQAYERTVKTFICPSDFMAQKMVEWGEPVSKFKVIRMPISQKERAPRGGGYLLAVGSLSPEKGYEELLQAAEHVPDMPIKIVGRGPLEDRLRTFIKSAKIEHVELVGFKRGQDLEDLYAHAEGFIACPIGYENAPLSVLDALACGLPLLATNIGGLPEMVEVGQNGYLVERADITGWQNALRSFTELDAADRDRMAAASYALAHGRFPSWEEHARMIEKCYLSS